MKKLKTNQEIQNEIEKIAEAVNSDYKGEEIDLIALNDSPKFFINDFVKHLKLKYKCLELRFINYNNRTPSGEVKIIRDLDSPVYDRNIILVDGIIISGQTHYYLSNYLMQSLPKSLSILSIARKLNLIKKKLPKTYTLFEFNDEIVEGYGFGRESLNKKKYLVDLNQQ